MEIELHPHAELESEEAALYYENRAESLGLRFVEELDKTFSHIKRFPKAWPEARDEIRKTRLNRFPYNVFYSIENNYILVLAIAHMSRKPFYWEDRIK